MVINQRDHSIVAFDQCCATLDPVATIVISDLAEFANGCAVDVPAQHAIHMVTLRVMRHSRFEFANEAHRVLYGSLGIGAERPETQTETPPDKIDERIEREQKLVA